MVEFNPDGSIKLPDRLTKNREENKEKLKNQRCIRVKRDLVSFSAPKKCVLHITLSDAILDNRFISTIYGAFKNRAKAPNSINKVNEKEFDVEIGTDFRRCTDCNSLINAYREFLDGLVIDEKGSCTFEERKFFYEDYFD
jgi:hypothetical protein